MTLILNKLFSDQIRAKTGVSRTKTENLVNAIKDVLDKAGLYDDIFKQKSTISSEQEGQGLKNLTPNRMFLRLPISLAQPNAENNWKKN